MWNGVNYCKKYQNLLNLSNFLKNILIVSINKVRHSLYFLDSEKVLYELNRIIKLFNRSNEFKRMPGKVCFIFILFLFIFLIIWICCGFYTIKEAERGVVLRFGKFHHLVQPGLNWRPVFLDIIIPVNVESVRELAASGMMLTSDENVVRVEMNVQYRITEPEHYLFSVTNADYSLRQATDSALRGVIGKYTMDLILTEGRTVVRTDTRRVLESIIYPYNMGITLLDVNFQTARPPEEVKAAFDDAIAARENEQQYIREAEAYSNEVKPRANGQAQRILEEGRAYKARTILEAQGEIQRFSKILPEYKLAPQITRERLYINTMERLLSKNQKILISKDGINNLLLIPSISKDGRRNGKKDIRYNRDDNNIDSMLVNTDNNAIVTNLNTSNTSRSSVSKKVGSSFDRKSASVKYSDISSQGRE